MSFQTVAASLRWLLLLSSIYVLICLFFFLNQERFIFFPEKLPATYSFRFSSPFKEISYSTEPGVFINAVLFSVPEPKGVIFYSHGNAGSLRSWGGVGEDFLLLGYDVLIYDFRGYGKSRGKRSEKALLNDALFIFDRFKEQYGANNIIIYGRSLGSAMAAFTASQRNPRMLILEAPFYSLEDIAFRHYPWLPRFFLRYRLRTYQYLKKVQCPVHIFHGTADEVVPYASGKRLATVAGSETAFYTLTGGRHNNLDAHPLFWENLKRILE